MFLCSPIIYGHEGSKLHAKGKKDIWAYATNMKRIEMQSRYPQKTHDEECNEKDPINLVFVNTDLDSVLACLIQSGWTDSHVKFKQFLEDPSYRTPCHKEEDINKVFGHLLRRFHVRIWQWGTDQVGSAHYETGRFFKHEVHHFEGAEEKIAQDFRRLSQWAVTKDKHNLGNRELERYNNGLATEISK